METVTTKKRRICKTGVTENKPGYYLGVHAMFLGYMLGSATAMELNNTESNPEFLRTILKGKDTLKLIFGAYIMLNILAMLSNPTELIKKIITIFCIINLIIVMYKTNGNMTIKKTRGPIRQGWVELSRVETGSLFQSHINIAQGARAYPPKQRESEYEPV